MYCWKPGKKAGTQPKKHSKLLLHDHGMLPPVVKVSWMLNAHVMSPEVYAAIKTPEMGHK